VLTKRSANGEGRVSSGGKTNILGGVSGGKMYCERDSLEPEGEKASKFLLQTTTLSERDRGGEGSTFEERKKKCERGGRGGA